MTGPIISVCVVTRNQRGFIENCIRSIAGQQVDATIRILVGDDASEDGTDQIVARLAAEIPHVEYLRRAARMGAVANMRDLMARASGEFVARVDGDDYWLPGKLQRQLDFMRAHPDCAAVYTNAIAVDEAGNRIGVFNDVGDARLDLAALLRRGNFLNNSSVMFRNAGRHAWLDVDEPQIDYRAHLWHARHGWIAQIGEPLAAYRVNTQGSMVAGMNARVRELYWEAICSVPREAVSDGDRAAGMADFLRRVILRAIRMRRMDLLREWTPRVFAASPYGRLRTGALALQSLARITGKEFAALFRKDGNGHRLRVLYRR